jgi:hypothetical protein
MRHKAISLAIFAALASVGFFYQRPDSRVVASSLTETHRTQTRRSSVPPKAAARLDYARFSHASAKHAEQKCDACHKFPSKNWKEARAKDAIPDITEYPEHSACIGCHRQQFFARERPAPAICSNCHVGVTPRFTARQPFPNPREIFDASPFGQMKVSEFAVSFAHDKHVDLVGSFRLDPPRRASSYFVNASLRRGDAQKEQKKEEKETSDPKSCAVCHQTYMPQGETEDEFVTKPPKGFPEDAFWLKKGTFKTSPDHTTCFTCHNTDTGIEPTQANCNACHKLVPPSQQLNIARAHDDYDPALAARMGITDKYALERWSRRDAARFRHEWLPHAGLACTDCHNVSKFNTLDRATLKVSVKSCGGAGTGCHIEETNGGILNEVVAKRKADPTFVCTKCHVLNGAKPLPPSHVEALPTPKPAAKKD